jgi:hypothetical protein
LFTTSRYSLIAFFLPWNCNNYNRIIINFLKNLKIMYAFYWNHKCKICANAWNRSLSFSQSLHSCQLMGVEQVMRFPDEHYPDKLTGPGGLIPHPSRSPDLTHSTSLDGALLFTVPISSMCLLCQTAMQHWRFELYKPYIKWKRDLDRIGVLMRICLVTKGAHIEHL